MINRDHYDRGSIRDSQYYTRAHPADNCDFDLLPKGSSAHLFEGLFKMMRRLAGEEQPSQQKEEIIKEKEPRRSIPRAMPRWPKGVLTDRTDMELFVGGSGTCWEYLPF